MPEDSLHQPHDKLFRATFSDPRNAAAFLCHHLGGPLSALVHRGSPSLCEKDLCGSGSAENQIKQLVLDLRTDLEFLAGKQPNAAVVFNAGVPSFGEGAKDRPQGDGAGEGKSGYTPPEGAEGGSVRVSVRRIHVALSTAFRLQGVFRQAARQLGKGGTGVDVESRVKLRTSPRGNGIQRTNRALNSEKTREFGCFFPPRAPNAYE